MLLSSVGNEITSNVWMCVRAFAFLLLARLMFPTRIQNPIDKLNIICKCKYFPNSSNDMPEALCSAVSVWRQPSIGTRNALIMIRCENTSMNWNWWSVCAAKLFTAINAANVEWSTASWKARYIVRAWIQIPKKWQRRPKKLWRNRGNPTWSDKTWLFGVAKNVPACMHIKVSLKASHHSASLR